MTAHVLVVDDDPEFRDLAARLLAGFGIGEVVQAGDCASALQAAGRVRPVAALVDIGLPDGDGIELAAGLATASWGPRVVLTSSDRWAAAGTRGIPFIAKEDLAAGRLRLLLTGEGG